MRLIDADALKELFSEVIGSIAKKPEMNGNLEHMIRASAMVIQMIDDAPSIQPEQHLDEWCVDCKEYDKEKHSCPRWNRVIRQTLLDAQPEQRWIPVSERLPEDNTRVQVTFANGEVGQSSWHKENEYNNGFDAVMHGVTDRHFLTFGVIAWMPLPEPYRACDEQESH